VFFLSSSSYRSLSGVVLVFSFCFCTWFLNKLSHTLSCHVSEKPETSLAPVATTMDLLTNMENSADQTLRQNTGSPSNAQSTDFLQQFGCFDPSNWSDVTSNKLDFRYVGFCSKFVHVYSHLKLLKIPCFYHC
jgi:hypothetical protein